MFEIGRLCVKIAGRDAGKKCLVVDVLDENYVVIDGQTRRRKCNITHLEPLERVVEIEKGASCKEVCNALKKLNIDCMEKKEKESKHTAPRPKKQKKVKQKAVVQSKDAVKPNDTKKGEKKEEANTLGK